MRPPFLSIDCIRRHMAEARTCYWKVRGKEDLYPLDAADLFERLFGLPTMYDDEGEINRRYGTGIIGCFYPPGQPSPWSQDGLIVVNSTPAADFDPTKRNETFTVSHEGGGHYIFHHLKGVSEGRLNRAVFCRDTGESKRKKDRLEWQADFAAGELMMPAGKVRWLLDGKEPGELINLDLYENRMIEYFGANRMLVETRLKVLGYRLMNPRYPWADWRRSGPRSHSNQATRRT